MACSDPKVFFQSPGHPLADRAVLAASLASDPMNQALGQLDGEDPFDFRDSQRGGLLLGGLYITRRLAGRNAELSGQTRDDLGPRLFSVQQLNGLVHAPGVLGYGRTAQYDTYVIPYTSPGKALFGVCGLIIKTSKRPSPKEQTD
jgi:hypothetical protein